MYKRHPYYANDVTLEMLSKQNRHYVKYIISRSIGELLALIFAAWLIMATICGIAYLCECSIGSIGLSHNIFLICTFLTIPFMIISGVAAIFLCIPYRVKFNYPDDKALLLLNVINHHDDINGKELIILLKQYCSLYKDYYKSIPKRLIKYKLDYRKNGIGIKYKKSVIIINDEGLFLKCSIDDTWIIFDISAILHGEINTLQDNIQYRNQEIEMEEKGHVDSAIGLISAYNETFLPNRRLE